MAAAQATMARRRSGRRARSVRLDPSAADAGVPAAGEAAEAEAEAAAEAAAAPTTTRDDPAAYVAGRLRRLLRVVVACLDVNCNGKIDRVDLQKAGEKGCRGRGCSRSGARGRCGRGSRRRRSEGRWTSLCSTKYPRLK